MRNMLLWTADAKVKTETQDFEVGTDCGRLFASERYMSPIPTFMVTTRKPTDFLLRRE